MKEVYIGDSEYLQAIQRLARIRVLEDRLDTFFRVAPVIVITLTLIVVLTRAFVPLAVRVALVVMQFIIVAVQAVSLVKERSLR